VIITVLFAVLSNPDAVKVIEIVPEELETGVEVGDAVVMGVEVEAGEVEVGVEVTLGEAVTVGVGVTEGLDAALNVFDKSMYATIDITRIMIIPIVR
jgi:hypothetical protein